MACRNYIFNTISSVFRTYGYAPIETPSMENLSTLMGKYGEEGDKLLFRILDSGEPFNGLDFNQFLLADAPESAKKPAYNCKAITNKVCEKGLRYDLTVPFARFVVQHQNEISFPFRRYQIQPVWRADRPQKGRYREFYQCDADVIGSNSQLNELELVQIVDRVFELFGIRVLIKINNRKVLTGLSEICGFPDKVVDITVAIDKIDKIGIEAVEAEMMERGLSEEAVKVIEPVLCLKGNNAEKLSLMKSLFGGASASGVVSQTGLKGIEELEELFGFIEVGGIRQDVEIDLSLARGLNYYTGAIFEVKALDFEIGSICGGGRYDNLTGIFGMPGVSGVGISFGADRIYDVLNQLDLYPKSAARGTQVMFVNFGAAEAAYCLPLVAKLRAAGIAAELYPDSVKMKKQMSFANDHAIPYVVMVGESEMQHGQLSVKNMVSGEQGAMTIDQLMARF